MIELINKIKKKKLFVFDLDGTLVDSIEVWDKIDRLSIKKAGATPRDTLSYERAYFLHTCTDYDIYASYEKYLYTTYKLNCGIENFAKYREFFSLHLLTNEVHLINGADKILKYLKLNNYMLALATSSDKLAYTTYIKSNQNILSVINFNDFFSTNVMTQEDVKNKKPAPDVYLAIKSSFKLSKNEIVIIEDSKTGVMAAKKAHIDCICIREPHSINDEAFLKANSILYINSYDELIDLLQL